MKKAHLDPVAWKKKVRIRRIVLITLAVLLVAAGVTVYLLRDKIVPAIRYGIAERAEDRGEITEAIDRFARLGTYRDANARAAKLAFGLQRDASVKTALTGVNVGDTVEFGRYEQDNDLGNGQEPIRWFVLAKEDGRLLLWSEYVLAAQPYHKDGGEITWADCSLREWLNGTFYREAFTEQEQALVAETHHENEGNPASYSTTGGAATDDRVYIISFNEILQYGMHNPYIEGLWAEPTDYAVATGADKHDWYGTAMWWIRIPGHEQNCATYCDMVGQPIYSSMVYKTSIGVRPIIWVYDGDITD